MHNLCFVCLSEAMYLWCKILIVTAAQCSCVYDNILDMRVSTNEFRTDRVCELRSGRFVLTEHQEVNQVS